MKFIYGITIIACICAGITAAYYIPKQPTPLDKCRAMVLAEVKKNQQFVDAVSPMTFHQALGGK